MNLAHLLTRYPEARPWIYAACGGFPTGFLIGTLAVTFTLKELQHGRWKRWMYVTAITTFLLAGGLVNVGFVILGFLVPISFVDDGSFDPRGVEHWKERLKRDDPKHPNASDDEDDEEDLF